jgi:hypothetical protein
MTGSLEGGMFLSQLIYWADKGGNKEGWFYKSYPEWYEECFLSEYQIRKLAKDFADKGFLETILKKANGSPTLHYRINRDALANWILKNLSIDTERFKNPSFDIQGTITKTTTENTTKSIEADACEASPSPHPTENTLLFPLQEKELLPNKRTTKTPTPQHSARPPSPRNPAAAALSAKNKELLKEFEPKARPIWPAIEKQINALAAGDNPMTPEEYEYVFRALKRDHWWAEKPLTPSIVGKQAGAILARVEDNQTTMELAYEW